MNANELRNMIEEIEAAIRRRPELSTVGAFRTALSEAIGRIALAMHTGDTHRLSDLLLLVAWTATAARANAACDARESMTDYTTAELVLRMLDEHAPTAFMLLAEREASTMIARSLARMSSGDIDSFHLAMCYLGIAALQEPIRTTVRAKLMDAHDLAVARRHAIIN